MADALELSPQEGAELTEVLSDSVLPAPPLPPDWQAEIAPRVADMDAGRTRFVAADEVLATLAALIESRQPRA